MFGDRTVAGAVLATALAAGPASAQSYPVGDEDGLFSPSPWVAQEQGVGGMVRSDGEAGWSELRVTHTSSDGVSLNNVEFFLDYGLYEDIRPYFRKLVQRSCVNSGVRLIVDGQAFRAASACYSFTEGDTPGLAIAMTFTPLEQMEDGVLDPAEPNCRAVQALRRGRSITVQFADDNGAMTDSLELTGRNSSAALRDIDCP